MSPQSWNNTSRWLPADAVIRYYWEGSSEDFAVDSESFNPDEVQVLIRHDQPRSRRRWQFSPRQENMYLAEEEH